MCFATKRAECLRERMLPRRATTLPYMPAPEPLVRISSSSQQNVRIAHQHKDRSSQGHQRQPKITVPPVLQWWQKEVVEYAFSHPHVRYRLERLMGSNVTRLTDRVFMQQLAERIQEEHVQQMQKRIRAREEAEVEREKKLILEGKITVDQVPHEFSDHPVFKISRLTAQAINFRRSKVQQQSMRESYMPPETLLALAKAMAPEGSDEEEDKELKALLEATLDETGVEEEGEESKPKQEEHLPEQETDMKKDADEDSKKLKSVDVKRVQYAEEEEREDLLPEEMEPTEETGDESEEIVGGVGEMVSEDSEKILDANLEDISENEKREAVLRKSQSSRMYRKSRLTAKSDADRTSDELLLSDDDLQREKERVSEMTAARSEWEAEVEQAEAMARERDKNYVMSEQDLRRLRYEAPLIEELRKQETVADLYRLADEIVGGLWTKAKTHPKEDKT